jgi:hypothetical protein
MNEKKTHAKRHYTEFNFFQFIRIVQRETTSKIQLIYYSENIFLYKTRKQSHKNTKEKHNRRNNI